MPVYFVRHFPKHEEEFDDLPFATVLLFDPVLERFPLNGLVDRLRAIPEALRTVDLLVVRGDPTTVDLFLTREWPIVSLFLPDTAVAICGLNPNTGSVELSKATAGPNLPSDAAGISVEMIRQIELSAWLTRTGAVFSDANCHYELPSGRHAEKFIRLADALGDDVNVRRVADWIALPQGAESLVIVADNGSLLPLVYELERRFRQRAGAAICISRTLGRYPGYDSTLSEYLLEIQETIAAHPECEALVIVSVSSTGKMLAHINNGLSVKKSIVVLCKTDDSVEDPPEAQILLSMPVLHYAPKLNLRCEMCDSGNVLISIDPKTYERLPKIVLEERPLNFRDVGRQSEFWLAVDRSDAIGLHVDVIQQADRGGTRHHEIYIDIKKLLTDVWFRKLAVQKLAAVEKPKLVLIPEHQTSGAIEDLVRETFPGTAIHFSRFDSFSDEVQSQLDRATSADLVLVCDDGIVSGRTLQAFRTAIYAACMRPDAPRVAAFVLLARPSARRKLEVVKRPYRGREGIRLYFAYEVLLPDTGDNCSWCKERVLVAQYMNSLKGDARRYAQQRYALLASELSSPLLMGQEGMQTEELKTWGAFLGDLSHKAAYASVVAAVLEGRESLKLEAKPQSQKRFNVCQILDSYFDPIILSAFFRTVQIADLPYGIEGYFERLEESLLVKMDVNVVAGLIQELCLAALTNRLPTDAIQKLLVQERAGQHPSLVMLRECLSKKKDT